jgi:hypothetical protein
MANGNNVEGSCLTRGNKNGEDTITQINVFINQFTTCFSPDRPSSGDSKRIHKWGLNTYKLHGSYKTFVIYDWVGCDYNIG